MALKEIKSLTGIRGLAAVYVMIFHWNAELGRKKPHLTNFLAAFLNHGYLSVDLFFILSGFVLGLSSAVTFNSQVSISGYKSFMYKRFVRIFPLYISITILYFLLFHFGGINKNLIVNLTLLQGLVPSLNNSLIPPGWSLTNEWVIYFLFPFLFYLIWKIRTRAWIIVLASFLLLLMVSIVRSPDFNWMNYNQLKSAHGFRPIISFTRGPASFLRAIAAYLLGIFAYLQFEGNKERSKLLKYTLLPLLALFFFRGSDILIILLMPFWVLYLTEENILSRFLSTKVIYFLGLISYSLYVNHYLFIRTYSRFSKMVGVNNNMVSFCYVLIGTLMFSTITYYIIEKPAMRLLRKRRLKIADPATETSSTGLS